MDTKQQETVLHQFEAICCERFMAVRLTKYNLNSIEYSGSLCCYQDCRGIRYLNECSLGSHAFSLACLSMLFSSVRMSQTPAYLTTSVHSIVEKPSILRPSRVLVTRRPLALLLLLLKDSSIRGTTLPKSKNGHKRQQGPASYSRGLLMCCF